MRKLMIVFFVVLISSASFAQDAHLTRNGKISFFSHTSLEDIEAANNEVVSTINTKTGAMQFLVLIKGFQFRKAAMQQHFNSKDYLDSDKFPKAEFKGMIKEAGKIDFAKEGSYPVVVEGTLTLHGITNKVSVNGTVTVKGGKLSSVAKFSIKRSDYSITVPSFTAAKIAELIDVTVSCSYQPYKN